MQPIGSITVDGLASVLMIVFVFVSINFFKAAHEPLWKISLFSFSFRLGRVRLVGGLSNISQTGPVFTRSTTPTKDGEDSFSVAISR